MTNHSFSETKHIQPYLLTVISFGLYLLTLPSLTALITPCLARIPGKVYEAKECGILLALDRFMLLALVGFGVSVIGLFLLVKKKLLVTLGLTASLLAASIVLTYLQFIPVAEKAIAKAPIYLDTLNK